MPELVSFQNALTQTDPAKRHVLLANGFSIACRPDIFLYGKLFEQAKFDKLPHAKDVFAALQTTDFERVIRALRDFAAIAPIYYPKGPNGRARAQKDADALREVLVQTIASSHPSRPRDIDATEFASAKKFLSNFNRIFTLNYDLLLYWALMQDEIVPDVRCDDGFRKPEDDYDAAYVTWEPDNSYEQNVYYLHGALHLFDTGPTLQKYTWTNTGVPLIDQIRAALTVQKFPLFVSEGTSDQKMTRIRHSDYLAKAYRSFLAIGAPGSSLFIHGHGMSGNDEHILRAIEHNKVAIVYVSLHGDPSSKGNQAIVRRASALPANRRAKKHPLEVRYYQAETADVW